jgi:ribokinase
MKYDVISFGSAVLDTFILSPDLKIIESDEFFTKKALAIGYGIKSEIERLVVASGGGGTNSAAGFSRLGLKTAIVARCGYDFAGKIIREDLKKEGVDDQFLVQVEGEGTDSSTILLGPDGGRTILVYRGSTRLEESVIDFNKLNSFYFYIASLEGNISLLEKIIDEGLKNSTTITINPGKKELVLRKELIEISQKVHFLVLNREEAAGLMETTIVDDKVFEKIKETFKKTTVLITEAEKGVNLLLPEKGHFFIDRFEVKMADATGAGDAFSAGFVGGLALGFETEKAVKLGAANGASVVKQLGCKPGLLRKNEIDIWLEEEKEFKRIS